MKKFVLLTAFGKDRPGIVAGVTRALLDLNGNVEDASMTRLGGEFAMMLIAALPSTVSDAKLSKAFDSLQKRLGVSVIAKAIPASAAHRGKAEAAKYLISLYGTDRPGIVHQVTEALARRKVSITDLQTQVIGAARKPAYVMLLEIQAAAGLDMDGLRGDLDRLRQELNVEISLQDIEAVPL